MSGLFQPGRAEKNATGRWSTDPARRFDPGPAEHWYSLPRPRRRAPVAQGIEHRPPEAGSAGSNPAGGAGKLVRQRTRRQAGPLSAVRRPRLTPATVQVLASSVRVRPALRGWAGDPHACRGLDPRRRPQPGAGLVGGADRRQRPAARAVEPQRRQGRRRRAHGRRADRRPRSPSRSAPRSTCSTRTTCAPGPGTSPTAFAGWDVYYAGKSFLCTAVARWVAEEGLGRRRLHRRRAGRGPAGRGRSAHHRPARQQQERGGARAGPGRRRRPDHRGLLRRDRADRPTGRCPRARRAAADHGAGHHRGRGAHPRVHRHRPRGPEVRLLHRLGSGAGRAARGARRAGTGAGRHPLPHRLADLRRRGLRRRRPPDAAAARRVRRGDRGRAARDGPGRRLRHRVHQHRHARRPRRTGRGHAADRRDRVRRVRGGGPAPVDRARSGDQRSERLRALHGRHRQAGAPRRRTRSGPTWPWTAG